MNQNLSIVDNSQNGKTGYGEQILYSQRFRGSEHRRGDSYERKCGICAMKTF